MNEIKKNEKESIKIDNLINYLKKNKTSKAELLYLVNLYRVSKDANSNEYIVDKKEILKLLKTLNNYLKESDNTPLVLKRIDKELSLLEEAYGAILDDDINRLSDIYYNLGFLSYESGITINPEESKKILLFKLKKGDDKDVNPNR